MHSRFVAAAFLSVASATLLAQTPDTATLTGQVQDTTHAVVAGAVVTLIDAHTGLHRSAVSNGRGEFSLEALPVAGEYDVATEKTGFAEAHTAHLKLGGGSTARLSIVLNVAPDQTAVTVEGSLQDVNVTQPEVGIRLTPEQIAGVPLSNRRITFLPLLNAANRPAISQGDIFMNQNLFTTNGGGRRQQAFVVDGANGNDSWGRQTIFTNIPEEAVQEMDVLTQSFSAEYGSSTGAWSTSSPRAAATSCMVRRLSFTGRQTLRLD